MACPAAADAELLGVCLLLFVLLLLLLWLLWLLLVWLGRERLLCLPRPVDSGRHSLSLVRRPR